MPSLLILVGTFFFINSACLRADTDDDYAGPCSNSRTTAPPGASARILEPLADQVFAMPDADGFVRVPIRLEASGIEIAPQYPCRAGTALFALRLQALEGPCASQILGERILEEGESETVRRLPSGTYQLDVQLVAGNGAPYQPAIEASVRFVVEASAALPDAGGCL